VVDKDIFEDLFVLELANNHMGRVDRGLRIIPRFRRCARPIYARGMAGPIERLAPLDKVHVMPSGTDEPPRK
jgi:hypothetical protein